MADLSSIATDEMREDYYASKMVLEFCKTLLSMAEIALCCAKKDGVALKHAAKTVGSLHDRINGNQKIMDVIKAEIATRNEELQD